MKITKLIKDKIDTTKDVIEDGVEKMTLMHSIPANTDEMDSFIEVHNTYFGGRGLRNVPVHNMVKIIQRVPHYISDEFIYI